MNGVIYKIVWWQQGSLDYEYVKINGKLVKKVLKTQRKYTKDERFILYRKALQDQVERQKRIIPFIKKGGFIYDKNLFYNYALETFNSGPYSIQFTCLVKFEDTNNEGKIEFMKSINKTGLLSIPKDGGTGLYLVKPYGKIY